MAEEGCAEQIKKGLDDLELLKPQLDAKCSKMGPRSGLQL
jgi:hypothetical protein